MQTRNSAVIGGRFGRLVVLDLAVRRKAGQPPRGVANCVCDCGIERTVLVQNLCRPDGTRSCGCLKKKGTMSTRFAQTRGTADRLCRPIHGLAKHPSYYRWANMIGRCEHPNHRAYKNYGARGISVAPDWRDVTNFLAYIDAVLGPCPAGYSLDRIDNNGNYEPGNVRWASHSEQVRNQRPRRS
jgi:hypothetical protein